MIVNREYVSQLLQPPMPTFLNSEASNFVVVDNFGFQTVYNLNLTVKLGDVTCLTSPWKRFSTTTTTTLAKMQKCETKKVLPKSLKKKGKLFSLTFFFFYLPTYHQCVQVGRFIGIWATFSKPVATISLPKSATFLGNFCAVVKIFNFSGEIIFWQLL